MLKNNVKEFDTNCNLESQKLAVDIKPKLKEFNKRLSENYGKELDNIESVIGKSNANADVQEFASVFEKALNGTDDPAAISKIRAFAQKQGYVVNELPTDTVGFNTFRVYHPEEGMKILTMRDMVGMKNSLKDTVMSSSAKSGTGYTRQDLAYSTFQDAWGEFLASRFPKEVGQQFLQLQSNYAPLAQAKWMANKIFQPYDAQVLKTSRGTRFFNQYIKGLKTGKADVGSGNLINILENGNVFSKGMGNISARMKLMAQLSKDADTLLTTHVKNLSDKEIFIKNLLAEKSRMKEVGKVMIRESEKLVAERLRVLRKMKNIGIGAAIAYGAGKYGMGMVDRVTR
jgi:hypothetical protein